MSATQYFQSEQDRRDYQLLSLGHNTRSTTFDIPAGNFAHEDIREALGRAVKEGHVLLVNVDWSEGGALIRTFALTPKGTKRHDEIKCGIITVGSGMVPGSQ